MHPLNSRLVQTLLFRQHEHTYTETWERHVHVCACARTGLFIGKPLPRQEEKNSKNIWARTKDNTETSPSTCPCPACVPNGFTSEE